MSLRKEGKNPGISKFIEVDMLQPPPSAQSQLNALSIFQLTNSIFLKIYKCPKRKKIDFAI